MPDILNTAFGEKSVTGDHPWWMLTGHNFARPEISGRGTSIVVRASRCPLPVYKGSDLAESLFPKNARLYSLHIQYANNIINSVAI